MATLLMHITWQGSNGSTHIGILFNARYPLLLKIEGNTMGVVPYSKLCRIGIIATFWAVLCNGLVNYPLLNFVNSFSNFLAIFFFFNLST